MPIETNLNVPPYFDDFDEKKNYYKVLFQPGVSVQVRELNQLQSQFQKQIERFGDNIFKSGTIISGCNFAFYNDYRYAKLKDNDIYGVPIVPSVYVGKYAKQETSKLKAYILNSVDGFESTAPDLKTIYLSYNNSGTSGTANSFSPNDILTITDSNNSIFSVEIVDGGVNFSNNDIITFTPKISVQLTSGTDFSVGDILQNEFGANVSIINVDSTTLSGYLLITYKPQTSDLTASAVDYNKWTFELNQTVKKNDNSKIGTISAVFGKYAEGRAVTDGLGVLRDVLITNGGEGYDYIPNVSVISKNNTTGVNAANLNAKNFITKVQIDSATSSIGSGYAFGVSEGVTYQKGYFLRVSPQTIIVDKYSKSPNNVVVGFKTEESIVDYNEDNSLFDNVNNENKNAPGANRLHLEPSLVVVSSDSARANIEFFDLVEWNDGLPYKQNKVTQYSRLGEEMAQRTFDESGNYVIDTFQVATSSTDDTSQDAKYYTVIVDPGQAYISGYKAQTLRNYKIDVKKGLDTRTSVNYISLNYGNYIRIQEVGGIFNFATGDTIDLYDLPATYISSGNAGTNIVASYGSKIGTARVRSMILENGIPGSSNCSYRLFLFNIKMNAGKNFTQVKSIYYNGTYKGIADVILQKDPSTNNNIAKLGGTQSNKLLFSAGVESLKNSNNTTYIYRTLDQSTTFSGGSNGKLEKSVATEANEYFPYSGELSSSQMQQLYVVPIGNNIYDANRRTGTVSVSTSSNVVTGSGTNFFSDFEAGDYICVEGGLANSINKIVAITNATSMVLQTNSNIANSSAYFRRTFPKNIPIPFGSRSGLSANVDVNSKVLDLWLKHSNGAAIGVNGGSSVTTALGYNIERRELTQAETKTALRNKFIKICCSNATYTTQGPWCVGVPDVFRLRNVYVSTSSTVNTNSQNVTNEFYIDHNQTANLLDLSWLYIIPKSKLKLTSSNYLLVEFDYFTGADSGGYFCTTSYLNTANAIQIATLDSKPLSELTTAAASLEVPEVYTYNGGYYDLLNTFDFRPAIANTVAPVDNTSIATAPVNPSSTSTFSNSNKKFPLPDAIMKTTIEQYLGRIDSVFISGDEGGRIYVLQGIPDVDPRKRLEANHPKDSLKLQTISVPPYPNITMNMSSVLAQITTTRIANEKKMNLRLKTKIIRPIYSNLEMQLSQPMVYTMEDIGNLERRIADLEYYVSLSILETSITNKPIPSSVDGSLNRFKFGFFADDFSTTNYSDIDNPQYAASIEVEGDQAWGISKSPLDTDKWAETDKVDPTATTLSPNKLVKKATNRVVPPKQIISINHHTENFDYIDYRILAQLNATVEPKVYTGCDLPPTRTVTNTSVVYNFVSYVEPKQSKASKYFDFEVSPTAGKITYFGDHYIGVNTVKFYQGNTLVASSNASAGLVQNWTNNDINTLKSYSLEWYNANKQGASTLARAFQRVGDAFRWSGKISWTHNPNNGNKYTIVVDKESPFYKFLVEYPVTKVSSITETLSPNCTYLPPIYHGRIKITNTGGGAWSCSKLFVVNGINTTFLNAEATGLKPNTAHNFFIDGIILNGNVIQIPTNQTLATNISRKDVKPMVSDANGKISFRIYFSGSAKGFASTNSGKYINNNWLAQIYTGYMNQTSFGSSGYSIMELKADNSSASLNVARRKPEITFATNNPNGNP